MDNLGLEDGKADSAQKGPEPSQIAGPGSEKWAELERLAQPVAAHRRVSESVVMEAIASLCRNRYLSLEQLSRLLKRNPPALRFRFVKPLIQRGVLRYRFPESPNRPDQAYTSAKSSLEKA